MNAKHAANNLKDWLCFYLTTLRVVMLCTGVSMWTVVITHSTGMLSWCHSFLALHVDVTVQCTQLSVLMVIFPNFSKLAFGFPNKSLEIDVLLFFVQARWPVSVCPSVCYKLILCQNTEQFELIFGIVATLGLSYTVMREFVSKNEGTSVWNFVPISEFRKVSPWQMDTIPGIVSFVQPMTITTLSHWASTFVYNTMGDASHGSDGTY